MGASGGSRAARLLGVVRRHDRRRTPSQPLPAHLLSGLRVHGINWLVEVVAVEAAFLLAFLVRYGGRIPAEYRGERSIVAVGLVVASYTVFDLVFHTYRIVWRHAVLVDMATLALTVLATAVAIGWVELGPMAGDRPIPLSVLAIGGTLAYLLLAHLKLLPRARRTISQGGLGRPLVIFGAGQGGITLAKELANHTDGYRPVAFLDDNRRKVGREIVGLPVVGTREALGRALTHFHAETVAVAMPSQASSKISEISRAVLDAGARPLVLPSLSELLGGAQLSLRDIGIEELVGRSEVTVDMGSIRASFTGRSVLITGAAGSIGSELARQVAALDPVRLVLLDNNESGLAEIRDELERTGGHPEIVVATITNMGVITRTFQRVRPDVVVHAAALKHVDILENQPRAAVEVNVLGTWHCARAAEAAGVGRFVFISTDKAVDPEGVLGASKRIGELMMVSLAPSNTVFTAVRFGNVLGSRGSVLPKFERQIAAGGPITVTHPDVRRFFMSIVEAVRLVLQSAAFAEPGRIYVLDMGDEVRIADFAQRLALLHGLRVPRDIEIAYTGLRAGERLRERLVGLSEVVSRTEHSRVRQVSGPASCSRAPSWDDIVEGLSSAANVDDGVELQMRLLAEARGPTADILVT
jgi:FlaA1/EpsC-like NDP-sugar epimerase